MRFRDFISVLMFGLLVFAAYSYDWVHVKDVVIKKGQVIRDDARYVNANSLATDSWSEFRIAKGATTLRLLTNAALQSTDSGDTDLIDPRQGFRYAIRYEILGRSGAKLAASEYHFRSNVRKMGDAKTGAEFNPIFFDDSNLVSAQTRAMQIAIDTLEDQPTLFRVRLISRDEGIQNVAARMLVRVEREDYEDRATWNRLSLPRRESLCRYCVYDPDLLTDSERTNLLRWRWANASTIGAAPDQRIYFVGEIDDQEVLSQKNLTGIVAEPETNATIPLPNGKAVATLAFTPASDSNPDDSVSVCWFGSGGEKSVVKRLVRQLDSPLELVVDGGLIEVESAGTVGIAVNWVPDDAKQADLVDSAFDITPMEFLSKTYVFDQQAVTYQVTHVDDLPTPFRVTLRYPFGSYFANRDSGDPSALPSVVWELLNDEERVIQSGRIELENEVSKFSFLSLGGGKRSLLSNPMKLHFRIPVGATQFRLRSENERFLINAHTRPNQLARVIKIPEDYTAFNKHGNANRSWYGVNAMDENRLLQENRVFIVHSQSQPPVVDDDMLAGRYSWQSYDPKGNWIAREVLVPQDAAVRLRDQSLAISYFLIDPIQGNQFTTPSTISANESPLRLIVVGEEPAGDVKLLVDGEPVFHTMVSSNRAQLTIDQDLPAQGLLTVSTSNPAKLFVSGRVVADAPRYLKRSAQRVLGGKLEFEYDKQGGEEELVTIQLYRDAKATSRSRIRAQIVPVLPVDETEFGPFESWTIRDRIFDLSPKPKPCSYVLGSEKTIDTGQRCFMRLGAELPAGRYVIRVHQLDDVEEIYSLVYRATPGQATSQRKLIVTSNSL